VAVTVTVAGLGTDAGAVYTPAALIEPFADPPLTAHVNVAVGALARNAVSWAVWFTGMLAVPGKTVMGPGTAWEDGVVVVLEPPPPLPPPHPANAISAAVVTAKSDIKPAPLLVGFMNISRSVFSQSIPTERPCPAPRSPI
jgi:hypothetical protein